MYLSPQQPSSSLPVCPFPPGPKQIQVNDLVAGQSQKLPGIPRITDKQLEVRRGGVDTFLCCGLPDVAAWALHSPRPAPTWHAHAAALTLATPRRPSSTWPSWPTTPSCTWSGVSSKAGRHKDGLASSSCKGSPKTSCPHVLLCRPAAGRHPAAQQLVRREGHAFRQTLRVCGGRVDAHAPVGGCSS